LPLVTPLEGGGGKKERINQKEEGKKFVMKALGREARHGGGGKQIPSSCEKEGRDSTPDSERRSFKRLRRKKGEERRSERLGILRGEEKTLAQRGPGRLIMRGINKGTPVDTG